MPTTRYDIQASIEELEEGQFEIRIVGTADDKSINHTYILPANGPNDAQFYANELVISFVRTRNAGSVEVVARAMRGMHNRQTSRPGAPIADRSTSVWE